MQTHIDFKPTQLHCYSLFNTGLFQINITCHENYFVILSNYNFNYDYISQTIQSPLSSPPNINSIQYLMQNDF